MTQIYEDGRFTRSVKIRESIFACMAPVAQGMNVPEYGWNGCRGSDCVAHMLALACT